jgi:hypothetical protein
MILVIIIVGKVEETVAREEVVVPGTVTIGRAFYSSNFVISRNNNGGNQHVRIPVASYAMNGITMVKTAHNVMFDRLLTLISHSPASSF